MPKLSRKINLFTDSVIARMSKVAEGCGAINLSEGFPDFPPPKAMLDRLAEVAKEGPHQYLSLIHIYLAFVTPICSTRSSVSRIPAVSTKQTGTPFKEIHSSRTSLVVPGTSVTIARSL